MKHGTGVFTDTLLGELNFDLCKFNIMPTVDEDEIKLHNSFKWHIIQTKLVNHIKYTLHSPKNLSFPHASAKPLK
jgi:hypothetical protein